MQRCTDQQPSDRGGLGFALRQYGERKRRSLGKKSEILHTSTAAAPAAASFKIPMICSSLKRFLFMASPPAITVIRKTHLLPGPILRDKLTPATSLSWR